MEACDRIHANKVQFSRRVQRREITPPPLVVRRYTLRTLDGHEIAPTTFTSRENVAARKKTCQDRIDVANETAGIHRDGIRLKRA